MPGGRKLRGRREEDRKIDDRHEHGLKAMGSWDDMRDASLLQASGNARAISVPTSTGRRTCTLTVQGEGGDTMRVARRPSLKLAAVPAVRCCTTAPHHA